jgi:integrase
VTIAIEGVPLRGWPLRELRRRHVHELADHLLRVDRRAVAGVQNMLRVLSAMYEDAITDELADVNPVRGVRVLANDPRARKPARTPTVWTFEQMHEFARAARAAAWTNRTARRRARDPSARRAETSRHPELATTVEALIRTLADTGLRLGETLGLDRSDYDGEVFRPRGTAHDGVLILGDTETKGHVREVPCAPGLAAAIREMPARIDTSVLYPTPSGRIWWERNFYRDIWTPVVEATGMVCTPHEFRHGYLTHLAAAGILDADLADVAGHGLDALIARYRHPVRRSFELNREVIG